MEIPGHGPKNANVAIIGEAPGFQESMSGRPFVGRAGQLLRESLSRVGLNPENCYITNVVKVRPPNNATPTTKEINAAIPALETELKSLPNLKYILLLGNVPLKAVARLTGITKNRGAIFLSDPFAGKKAFATLHPAAVLRNQNYRNGWLQDLATFASMVRDKQEKERVVVVSANAMQPSCTSPADIEAWEEFSAAFQTATTGALDIETTIGDVFQTSLIALGISFDGKTGFVFPGFHPDAPCPWTLDQIRDLFLQRPDIKWIMHNGAFDRLWLLGNDIPVALTHDTMAMAYLLHTEERKSLEVLSSVYLGATPYKNVDYKNIMSEPFSTIAKMNAIDAMRTYRLFDPLWDKLSPALKKLYLSLLMPAVNRLIEITLNGIPVNMDKMKQLTTEVELAVESGKQALQEMAGYEINPNSPRSVAKLLFETWGLPVLELTPTGAPSTGKDILGELTLGAKDEQVRDWLIALGEWRTNSKQLSTYLNKWPDMVSKGGRMHPRYKPLFVVTGRLSSEQPNIQNVPRDKRYREIFEARPGHKWIKADYSQLELRIAAWVAQERTMLEAFRQGEDIHTLTARKILGSTSSDARLVAKTINFGLLYGSGSERLRKTALQSYGVVLTPREASTYRQEFFNLYSGLPMYYHRIAQELRNTGKVVSPLGRVRHLPDVYSGDSALASRAVREGINHPIQSLGSDILLMSLVRIMDENIDGLTAVAEVHDEIDFEVREYYAAYPAQAGARIKEVMEDISWLEQFGVKMNVPIYAEIAIGDSWGDTHPM